MIEIVGTSKLTCHLAGEKTYKREVGFCFTEQGFALSCPGYDTPVRATFHSVARTLLRP